MEETPGADGCITERSLNDDFVEQVDSSSRVDIVGVYDEIT
jgi:hypothetical protein